MAHAVYVKGQSRPIQHLDPGEIGLYFDGKEWTHIPPAIDTPAENPVERTPRTPARKTDTKRLVCAECGTVFEKRPGRGRPPKRCYECKGA